ncbi:uncharacterized protein LOC111643917 [Copidosoma floridanum]|uniref:uncharacterized protein LOC111643917 n=1 Tax=Copidosoma floridanum TaxID=29053 RepID=UPI000C6F8B13|nr:uncharacterized protein LOC111643917 [Copidosoma floridanum]
MGVFSTAVILAPTRYYAARCIQQIGEAPHPRRTGDATAAFLLTPTSASQAKQALKAKQKLPCCHTSSAQQASSGRFSDIVLAGDLNSDMLGDDYYARHLRRLILENSMYLAPTGATHHCPSADTWIDVIVTNSSEVVRSVVSSDAPYINGHDYLYIDYALSEPSVRVLPRIREFRHFSAEDFSAAVSSGLARVDVDDGVDVDTLLGHFQEVLRSSLDIHAPLVERRQHRRPVPWFNAELRERCRARDRVYMIARRTGDPGCLLRYRGLRSALKRDIREAREEYLRRALEGAREPSQRWSILRRFGIVGGSQLSPLHFISPVVLSRHFSAMSCTHLPCTVWELEGILGDAGARPDGFSLAPVSFVGVSQAMAHCMVRSRGRSLDGLSLSYFRGSLAAIVPFLTGLINRSFESCRYPAPWRRSVIVPLSKIAQPIGPSDVRPVANMAHFAKVLDVLVSRQVVAYLEGQRLLSPMQSGFRRGHSTQSALLKLTEDVRVGMEAGKVTILVLFDFRRAFDSISHVVLLKAMSRMNFSPDAIRWFHSYLSDRSQAVVGLDGVQTDFLPCTSGVPQGSSLGPILFLIVIDSILAVLSHSTGILFADDLQAYMQCRPSEIAGAVGRFNEDIGRVVAWASEFGLQLHFGKLRAMLLTTWKVIPLVSSVKDLGVTLSSDLLWNADVAAICSRVHGVLCRLRYQGGTLSFRLRAALAVSLVVPHFDYACLVYMGISGYLATKLDRLSNTVVRRSAVPVHLQVLISLRFLAERGF